MTTANLDPIDVLCVTADNGLAGAKRAFAALEASLPSLTGRRFYGVYSQDGTYRDCVARREEDEPAAARLQPWVIPGGRYARTKLDNWRERLADIGPTYEAMAEAYPEDPTRPSLEFYRSEKELILFLPIRGEDAGT
jgi:hypothetical protein